MFTLQPNDASFLTTASWIFKSEIQINLAADTVWQILKDDEAWKIWHPEVAKIDWLDMEGSHRAGCERVVLFKDTLFMILLVGPAKIHEVFDVWEENEKVFGIYFKAINRPSILTYKSAREEFKVQAIDENSCIFTRTVALEPGFLVRNLLGFIVYPRLNNLFTKKCPTRFLEAVEKGRLPILPD